MTALVVKILQPASGKRILDATFGRGGHSRALLRHGAEVVALDKDAAAVAEGEALKREILAEQGSVNFEMNRMDFRELGKIADEKGAFDGILLDLGVSSPQIDSPERGFSFMQDGPLDMRMDENAPRTAAEIVNTWSAEELTKIFFQYGEERHARQIAGRIVQEREKTPFTTTLQLASFIEHVVGGRRGAKTHPATRIFQALRIAVNDELGALEEALAALPRSLKPGGRLAIISFHSLEDRMVKRFIRQHSEAELREEGMAFGCSNPDYCLKKLGDWAPDEEEIAENPRSRSARLRAAERLAHVA